MSQGTQPQSAQATSASSQNPDTWTQPPVANIDEAEEGEIPEEGEIAGEQPKITEPASVEVSAPSIKDFAAQPASNASAPSTAPAQPTSQVPAQPAPAAQLESQSSSAAVEPKPEEVNASAATAADSIATPSQTISITLSTAVSTGSAQPQQVTQAAQPEGQPAQAAAVSAAKATEMERTANGRAVVDGQVVEPAPAVFVATTSADPLHPPESKPETPPTSEAAQPETTQGPLAGSTEAAADTQTSTGKQPAPDSDPVTPAPLESGSLAPESNSEQSSTEAPAEAVEEPKTSQPDDVEMAAPEPEVTKPTEDTTMTDGAQQADDAFADDLKEEVKVPALPSDSVETPADAAMDEDKAPAKPHANVPAAQAQNDDHAAPVEAPVVPEAEAAPPAQTEAAPLAETVAVKSKQKEDAAPATEPVSKPETSGSSAPQAPEGTQQTAVVEGNKTDQVGPADQEARPPTQADETPSKPAEEEGQPRIPAAAEDDAELQEDQEQQQGSQEKRMEKRREQDQERERERERERIRESERERELMIARENEEARLIWLSLPGNDHPQYYTDTDTDSCYGDGGMGLDGTDDEDKDLNPPRPLTLQEHYPPLSYTESFGLKRKIPSHSKEHDNVDLDIESSRARSKRKAHLSPERVASSSRLPLPDQPMISIDDFPVPDSSIRGEPEDRPLFRARSEFNVSGGMDENGEIFSDSSDSDEEASRLTGERKRRHGNRIGNRGNKLSRRKGVRWYRRGKLGGWTEARMEKEIGDRVRHRIEALQKESIRALISVMPEEDKKMLSELPALKNGLLPAEARFDGTVMRDARGRLLASDLSEAARLDAQLGLGPGAAPTLTDDPQADEDEHLTSTSLAPKLLKPAETARQLLTSHTLRHTFRNPHIGALGKTALDLIESEGVLGRAIGRCWSAMERGGWTLASEPKANEMEVEEPHTNGHVKEIIGPLADNPALIHLDKLFVTRGGLAIPKLDEMGQPIFDGESQLATTLLPASEQRAVVLAALECLHELAADSREYVERLEEVCSRLAAIKRRRAEVWRAVREWALEKEERGEGERPFQPLAEAAHIPAPSQAKTPKSKGRRKAKDNL